MTYRTDLPWRPFRESDIGSRCAAHYGSTRHEGTLVKIFREGDERGLVDIRFDDGVMGTWPIGRVVFVRRGKHLSAAPDDSAYKESHKPRHCAGVTSCLHDHAGASPALPPMGTFRQRIARITGRDKRLAPVEIVGRAS